MRRYRDLPPVPLSDAPRDCWLIMPVGIRRFSSRNVRGIAAFVHEDRAGSAAFGPEASGLARTVPTRRCERLTAHGDRRAVAGSPPAASTVRRTTAPAARPSRP